MLNLPNKLSKTMWNFVVYTVGLDGLVPLVMKTSEGLLLTVEK